jgi:6-phosphofructokinase 2
MSPGPFKKLGGKSRLLYPAGGLTGKRLQDLLEEEGLDHRPFPIDGMIRESLVILEESTGRQYRFGMPGPELRKKEWEQFLQELSVMDPSPDLWWPAGAFLRACLLTFMHGLRVSERKGTKTIVDVSGKALKEAVEEGVFLIKPNVREFRELVGEEIKEESQIKAEAQKMVKNGRCEVLVISLGAAGALAVSKDFAEHILPPTVPIISKVGAGDSMVAGITLSLARGKPLRESVLFGVAAGTAAVMTPGTELCRREDVDGYMRSCFRSTKGPEAWA